MCWCVDFTECITWSIDHHNQFVHILIRFTTNRHIALHFKGLLIETFLHQFISYPIFLLHSFPFILFTNRYTFLNFKHLVVPVYLFTSCFCGNSRGFSIRYNGKYIYTMLLSSNWSQYIDIDTIHHAEAAQQWQQKININTLQPFIFDCKLNL